MCAVEDSIHLAIHERSTDDNNQAFSTADSPLFTSFRKASPVPKEDSALITVQDESHFIAHVEDGPRPSPPSTISSRSDSPPHLQPRKDNIPCSPRLNLLSKVSSPLIGQLSKVSSPLTGQCSKVSSPLIGQPSNASSPLIGQHSRFSKPDATSLDDSDDFLPDLDTSW